MSTLGIFFVLCVFAFNSFVRCDLKSEASKLIDAIGKQEKVNKILKDVYATIEMNIHENTRNLKLEDFSWGIFKGTKGRLQGFQDFNLVNNNTLPIIQRKQMNLSFEFTVPVLRAVWEKSICFGYTCSINIELQNAIFILNMIFDADECVIDHLAYLKKFANAKCHADYVRVSPVSTGIVETTVKVLSQVLNTSPFEKIIKDNVNYALLQLPLFTPKDVRRLCSAYRLI